MTKTNMMGSKLGIWLLLVGLSACDRPITSCVDLPDEPLCAMADAGMDGGNAVRDGSADASGDGGAEAGTDAGSDGGQPDAGQDAGPCGMPCMGETPLCDEASRACVECLERSDCTTTELPACVNHACEECEGNNDCTNPTASRCEASSCTACGGDGDCSHIEGLNVCIDGACVECRSNADCAENEGCELESNTCRPFTAGTGVRCSECVRDAECQAGMLCVPMRFGVTALGNFCAWRKDAAGTGAPAGNCFNAPPYVRETTATSVDGVMAPVCVLQTSTCAAHRDFRRPICTMDTECGAPAVNDGFCVMGSRCTVECTTYEDCPCSGASCSAQYECVAGTCSISRTCVRNTVPLVCGE